MTRSMAVNRSMALLSARNMEQMQHASSSPRMEEIYEEAVTQFVAERLQAAKAGLGRHLLDQLHDQSHALGGAFIEQAIRRVQAVTDPDVRELYLAYTLRALEQYDGHVDGLLDLAARVIAREVDRSVLAPREKQGGHRWWRW